MTTSTANTTFKNYLSLIRFSHTIFALPFALLSAALAWFMRVDFQIVHLIGILLCMVFARTAAMAFNRYVDRNIDAANPRTENRHIPAGTLSAKHVLTLTLLSSLGFVLSTLLFWPNRLPLFLSVPVLAFLLGYSYVKRFSVLAHYWLAAALMLSPLATWIALTGTLDLDLLWLAAAIFFWVGGFDIIYACQDADFDRQAGLFSIPARFGVPTALKISALSHFLCVGALVAFGYFSPLGPPYFIGVGVVGLLLIYEHSLVNPHDLSRAGIAFFNINAMIGLGLLAVGILDLYLQTL